MPNFPEPETKFFENSLHTFVSTHRIADKQEHSETFSFYHSKTDCFSTDPVIPDLLILKYYTEFAGFSFRIYPFQLE